MRVVASVVSERTITQALSRLAHTCVCVCAADCPPRVCSRVADEEPVDPAWRQVAQDLLVDFMTANIPLYLN